MSTVIYLANQQIQVVTGNLSGKKINIEKSLTGFAPEGSIINGIIMDTDSFVSFVKEFWQSNGLPTKNVTLLVNSSKFFSKTIDMPTMSAKKTREFVVREFSDIKRDEEVLYSYATIESDKVNSKIYAECVPQEMIVDYKNIFQEAGVTLGTIYSADSSLISFIDMITSNIARTFVFQIADSMTLTTILWVNGSFYYLNSIRSFYDQGTDDYAGDVARSISKIIQFMQANQIDSNLEMVIISGLNPNDYSLYKTSFEMLDINVRLEMFNPSMFGISGKGVQGASYCVRALSGLLNRGKKQNLVKALIDTKKKKKASTGFYKDIIWVIIITGIMVIALISSIMLSATKKKELKKIDEYNEDVIVMCDIAKYNKLLEQNSLLNKQKKAIIDLDDNIHTYPVGTTKINKIIYDCAGIYANITFKSFDADAGVVSFSASCESVDNINLFIKELLQRSEFNSVDYTGYTYNEENSMWDVHVTCILSEAVGRQ